MYNALGFFTCLSAWRISADTEVICRSQRTYFGDNSLLRKKQRDLLHFTADVQNTADGPYMGLMAMLLRGDGGDG